MFLAFQLLRRCNRCGIFLFVPLSTMKKRKSDVIYKTSITRLLKMKREGPQDTWNNTQVKSFCHLFVSSIPGLQLMKMTTQKCQLSQTNKTPRTASLQPIHQERGRLARQNFQTIYLSTAANHHTKWWSHPHHQRLSEEPRFPPSLVYNDAPQSFHLASVRKDLAGSQDVHLHQQVKRVPPHDVCGTLAATWGA